MMLRNLNTRILQDDNFGFNARESTTTTKAVLITKTPVQINAHTHTYAHDKLRNSQGNTRRSGDWITRSGLRRCLRRSSY